MVLLILEAKHFKSSIVLHSNWGWTMTRKQQNCVHQQDFIDKIQSSRWSKWSSTFKLEIEVARFQLKQLFSVSNLNINAQQIMWPTSGTKRKWNYLSDMKLPYVDPSKVTTFIGRDVMRIHKVLDTAFQPMVLTQQIEYSIILDGAIRDRFWCLC